jgi:hypothetical protein
MAHAEHPLVTSYAAHAAADLIGECLECKPLIGGGEGAGNAVARALSRLDLEKDIDGFLKPAL